MIWFWVVCAAIAGLIIGALIGLLGLAKFLQPDLIARDKQWKLTNAADLTSYLDVLRRELANWMLRHDPDRYLRLYKRVKEEVAEIRAANAAVQKARLVLLSEKYPSYAEFDVIGVRDYVLYDDTLSMFRFDEIETAYKDIINFQALKFAVDEAWRWKTPPTNDSELEHLENYSKRLKDTRFKNRLQDAISRYYIYRSGREAAKDDKSIYEYETDMFNVRHVSHFAENRYGVHFKDTDEYGIFGFFYLDDASKPPLEGFYRSNEKFDKEVMLHELTIDIPA